MGTSVRDRKYEVSIAKTTAIASGTKSDLAAPVMNATGTKTMQMQSVETNAGVAISAAPSRMARTTGFCCAMFRWTFSISTVASSTRMPTASAIPPRVMTLSVSPSHASTMIDTRIDSGIETMTMSVLRQLPRKTRSMSAVSPAAMPASFTTPCTAARTKTDWSKRSVTLSSFGSRARVVGSVSRTRLTTSSVLALPCLRIDMSTDFLPSTCTMFVCGVVAVAHVGHVADVTRSCRGRP